MKFILGTKLGSGQLISKEGEIIPVTFVGAEDNVVLQIKSVEKDGYKSAQIGTGIKKANRLTKALNGHFKNLGSFSHVREFKIDEADNYNIGDKINLSIFSIGDKVAVSAHSIGRGFQGVVKRHGFKGGPASHGHTNTQRRSGSIGCRFPQRVLKGKRMAGRMGGERVTVKNLKVIKVDEANGILAVKGSVPGKNGTRVEIKG